MAAIPSWQRVASGESNGAAAVGLTMSALLFAGVSAVVLPRAVHAYTASDNGENVVSQSQ